MQDEWDFSDEEKAKGNEYTVWRNGTESLQGNNGAAFHALPKLWISYVCEEMDFYDYILR